MQEGDELAQILDGAADTVHRVDEDLVDASFLDHLPHDLSLGALEEGDHPGHLLFDEKIEAVHGGLGLAGRRGSGRRWRPGCSGESAPHKLAQFQSSVQSASFSSNPLADPEDLSRLLPLGVPLRAPHRQGTACRPESRPCDKGLCNNRPPSAP